MYIEATTGSQPAWSTPATREKALSLLMKISLVLGSVQGGSVRRLSEDSLPTTHTPSVSTEVPFQRRDSLTLVLAGHTGVSGVLA